MRKPFVCKILGNDVAPQNQADYEIKKKSKNSENVGIWNDTFLGCADAQLMAAESFFCCPFCAVN